MKDMKIRLKRKRVAVKALERALAVIEKGTPSWAAVAATLQTERRQFALMSEIINQG